MCKAKHHWGPYLWSFIHTIAIVETPSAQEAASHRLHALAEAIPCPTCKSEYSKKLDVLRYFDLRQPMVLFYWTVDLHNYVNTKLGKPTVTYTQARQIWCANQ